MKRTYNLFIHTIIFLLMIFSFPISNLLAEEIEQDKGLDTLVSELIYYFGVEAETDVLRTLDEIEKNYPEDYELWTSVIDEWYWIENEMEENIDVAPDGLPEEDTHVFIVLGFALKDNGEMEDELIGRLEVALESAKKYPNSYVLVTGGVEKNGWTEGDRMEEWLIKNGLSEDRIIVENESSKTVENASFSYEILYNDYEIETASLITSQYHLKRGSIFYYTMSLLMAEELNKEFIEFIGEGNVGWFREDKTEESMSLKTRGMAQIADVEIVDDLPTSTLRDLRVEGDFDYNLGESLNVTIYAQYDSNYERDITDSASLFGYDPNIEGEQEIEIIYKENNVEVKENITINIHEDIDISLLEELIIKAKEISNKDNEYTDESFKNLQSAIKEAENILETAENQDEVNRAYEHLQKAHNNLERTSTIEKPLDVSKLEELIDKSATITSEEEKYTEKSFLTFKKALEHAKNVLNTAETQKEVDLAYERLDEAIEHLEEIPKGKKAEKETIEKGEKLPKTATSNYYYITVGTIFILLGSIVAFVIYKRKQKFL